MTALPPDAARIAVTRFGLGARPGEVLPADPAAWLLGQLGAGDTADFAANLPSTADGLTVWREANRLQLPPGQSIVQPLLRQDLLAQMREALTTKAPFRERLVWFWTNHFTVSLRAGVTASLVGPFIREAIRPNVTAPFTTMLLAVMRHPAMLMYLDNNGSTGPASPAGLRSHRGLNENLARECLELHTVGVQAGYTQQDVTALARLLTGWSVEVNAAQPGYTYRAEWHEPGEHVLMGERFPPGEAGGVLALGYLAGHPATHRHLATKLARHFVADAPPPDAVRALEATLRDTAGDLGQAARTLVGLPAAWQKQTKFRAPADFVVAVLRALALPEAAQPPVDAAMGQLGQPLWNAPLPNGWPDTAADWASPAAMLQRVDWTYAMAARAPLAEPAELLEATLGPLAGADTRRAVAGAGSRRDALTLLLSSPEFQRR